LTRALYGNLLEEFAGQAGEREAAYGPASGGIREEIVRCVWFGCHFPPDGLTTEDGRRVEVLSPGWWNVEGGPDFIKAELLLEGEGRVVGDVEVHTASSAWYAHGHHQQPEYDDVVLHVVMWNDREEPTVQLHSGAHIPQLLVEIVDLEDSEAPAEELRVPGKYCGSAYKEGELKPSWLGAFLDAAGDYRVLSRAKRFTELFESRSREQLLYERVAEALGYKNNRVAFLQLASLLPIESLRRMVAPDADEAEKSLLLEAVLFGTSGLLQAAEARNDDPETVSYMGRLKEAWRGMDISVRENAMSAEHWQFGGTRPVNYPTRRIPALAVLLARHLHGGLFSHLVRVLYAAAPQRRRRLDTVLREALADVFCSLEHPYWSWRCTFGGARLAAPRALVGKERAVSIIVDVLLPLLLAHAQEQDDEELVRRLHILWRHLPRRPDNAVTRRMQQVIFGGAEAAGEVVNSARRQQGLHQLYRDFCGGPDGCNRCVLYLANRAGKPLSAV